VEKTRRILCFVQTNLMGKTRELPCRSRLGVRQGQALLLFVFPGLAASCSPLCGSVCARAPAPHSSTRIRWRQRSAASVARLASFASHNRRTRRRRANSRSPCHDRLVAGAEAPGLRQPLLLGCTRPLAVVETVNPPGDRVEKVPVVVTFRGNSRFVRPKYLLATRMALPAVVAERDRGRFTLTCERATQHRVAQRRVASPRTPRQNGNHSRKYSRSSQTSAFYVVLSPTLILTISSNPNGEKPPSGVSKLHVSPTFGQSEGQLKHTVLSL